MRSFVGEKSVPCKRFLITRVLRRFAGAHKESCDQVPVAPDGTWQLSVQEALPNIPHGPLNELFYLAGQYQKRSEYAELLQFIGRFRFYSAYNASLIRTQMPGATYVAPAKRWRNDDRRTIRVGARPITILQPGGPVMFVFDVSDTVSLPDALPLPAAVTEPCSVLGSFNADLLGRLEHNARRDGVVCLRTALGSQQGGSIQTCSPGSNVTFEHGRLLRATVTVPLRYAVQLRETLSPAAQFAVLIHELAHLYCGHLGSPDLRDWPDRRNRPQDVEECEAESVAHLVCSRYGLSTNSDTYLAGYLESTENVPEIDFDLVFRSAAAVQEMCEKELPPRPARTKVPESEL